MGDVVEGLISVVGDVIDGVIDVVETIWYDVVVPILEEIFSWFGIEDETVVHVQKVSIPIFGDSGEDVVHMANVKAVMSMVTNGGSFFPWYIKHTHQTYANMKAFYRYAENGGYIHGLPEMTVKGSEVDYDAIDSALDTEIGVPCTRLSSQAIFPSDEVYFKDKWQTTPYFYVPWANTLTYTDPYGVSWDDYTFDSVVYVPGNDTFDITVSRIAAEALFWIIGPLSITEGDSATYKIKCNRTVPVGEVIDIDLAYGGTAVDPADYSAVLTAQITAGNTEVDVVVTTSENGVEAANKTIIVTLDTVTNTNAAFEATAIHSVDSVTTTIVDDDAAGVLTMPSVLVNESDGNAIVPVKLENATGSAFTVDYALTNGTALGGGIDFDSTAGTLNFTGSPSGEIQNITIPITSGDGDDDNEYFTVSFTACSDPTIDYSHTTTVTITDLTDEPVPAGNTVLSDVVVEPGYIKDRSLVVTYHENTNPASEWFYWVYKLSDGTYPGIEPTMSTLSSLDMLPIGILRKDKVFVNVAKTTETYKTTKRLLDMLFLDIDEIIDNLAENPDINQVDDAFINFAICPNSTPEIVSKILWLSYHNIIVIHGVSSNTNEYSASFHEQDVQNAVAWTDHTYTADIAGTLASGQVYEHEQTFGTDTSSLIIRNQTGPGLYDELEIINLNAMAAIEYAGYHKMAFNKLGDDNFTIPISHYIMNDLKPIEHLVAYEHLLRLDMYAIQVTHIEWYQTSSFITLFKFAAVIITIWTAGLAGGVWAIIQQLVINYMVVQLVIFIAEETGNAALAAIVGLVAMIALGSFSGTQMFDMTTAQGLVNLSTEFANNLTLAYDVQMQELSQDIEDLNKRAEERLEQIKEATPDKSPITSDFLVAMKSVDTTMYPAVAAQYNFDLLYNYDMIIKDYHDYHLQIGTI